jgi:outer membrane protein assembly factor BamA
VRGGFSAGWGGRRYVHASVASPWILGRRLAVGAAIERSRDRNRGEAQQEDRSGLALSLAPTRGLNWRFPLDAGWEGVETRPDPPDSLRPVRRDDHRWLGAGVRRDTRGSPARAVRGSVLGLRAVGHGGLLGGSTSLLRYECDLLRLVPTGGRSSLTLASRCAWSRGDVPSFLRLGLGGASTLRGSAPGEYRGESRWFGWVEERFPLLPAREYTVAGGRYTLDVTVDGAIFLDAGSVWSGDALQRGEARARWGGGVGLRILLPLLSLVQCDVGTDGRAVLVHTLTGLRL